MAREHCVAPASGARRADKHASAPKSARALSPHALLLMDLHRQARAAGDRLAICLHAALGLGFFAKIAFEFYTGGAVFVSAESYSPVPLAHVVGAGAGVVVGLWAPANG